MDIVKIQSLIAQGRIIDLSSTDPNLVYLQLGVYQAPNSRLSSGDANTYAPYVINLNDILSNASGGTTASAVIKKTISLTDSGVQSLSFPSTGLYIIESAIVTNPSTDLSGFSIMGLELYRPGNTAPFLTTLDVGPPSSDQLNLLYTSNNYINMFDSGPTCFPPPCNDGFVYNGATAGTIDFQVITPALSDATVDVYVKLFKLV